MILATGHGNVEVRARWGNEDRIPLNSEATGMMSGTGKLVTKDAALGLPAVMNAIRLIAETIASLPLIVYEGEADEKERVPDAPQWSLLHDSPNPDATPFDVWSYVIASTQGWGGGFLLKGKSLLRGVRQVMTLDPLDPSLVTPRMQGKELVFDYWDPVRLEITTLSGADVIYVPGLLIAHPKIGVSPISAHREAIGGALALEEFANKFFANDATPGLVIKSPDVTTKAQRQEAKEAWDNGFRASRNAHRSAVLPPGWDVAQIGVSPADAQYVDGQKWGVDQVARVFKVHPASMIGGTDNNPRATPEERNSDFLRFSLTSHIVRLEQRLHADNDLFPDKTLRPQFLADGLTRADIAARYGAYTQARQAGWLSINDIRRKEGEPPIDGGDVYQTTPVGGAPNLQPGQETSPANDVEPDTPAS